MSLWYAVFIIVIFVVSIGALELGNRSIRNFERSMANYRYARLQELYHQLLKKYYIEMVERLYANEDHEVRERMRVFWLTSIDKLSKLPSEEGAALQTHFIEKMENAATKEQQSEAFQDYMWALELLPDPS